jgi:hypothetical protein
MAALAYKKGDKEVAQHLVQKAQQARETIKNIPGVMQQSEASYAEEQNFDKKKTFDFLSGVSESLEKSIVGLPQAATEAVLTPVFEGLSNGLHSMEKSAESFSNGNIGTGTLQLVNGAAQVTIGVMMSTPEGVLFNQEVGVAQDILPDKLFELMMSPASTVMKYFVKDPSEAAKAASSIGDVILSGLIIAGTHKGFERVPEIADKIKKNEPLTSEDVTTIKEAVGSLTPEEISEASQKVVGDHGHNVKDEELDKLKAQRDKLAEASKDKSIPKEIRKDHQEQVDALNKKIAQQISKKTQEEHRQAALESIQKQIDLREKYLKDNPDLSEEEKSNVESKINELNKQLNKKPSESESQKSGEGQKENGQKADEKRVLTTPEAGTEKEVPVAKEAPSAENKVEGVFETSDKAGNVYYKQRTATEVKDITKEEYERLKKEQDEKVKNEPVGREVQRENGPGEPGGVSQEAKGQPEQVKRAEEKEVKLSDDDKFVNKFINSGMLASVGETMEHRVDFGMSTAEVKKAIQDIKNGDDTAAARRLKEKILETQRTGQVPMIQGTGGKSIHGNRDLSEFREMLDRASETLKTEENATQKGEIKEGGQPEHIGAETQRVSTETGDSNSPEQREEIRKEEKGIETGAKNAVVNQERKAAYKGIIDKSALTTTDEKVYETAYQNMQKGEVGFEPRSLAAELADNPRVISAEQEAALVIDRANIINDITGIDRDLEDVRGTGSAQEADLLGQRDQYEKLLDTNDRALTFSGTRLGQALAIRRRMLGLDYSIQRLRGNWFKDNPGEKRIPTDVEAKLKDYERQINELSSKLAESEKLRQDEIAKQAINNIKESTERINKKIEEGPKLSNKERAKRAGDFVRKFKNTPLELKDENGNPIDITKLGVSWNDIVEGAAKSIEDAIEKSLDVADGVKEYLDKAEWYSKLTDKTKDSIKNQLEDHFTPSEKSKKEAEMVEGKVKIPASMIRDLVSKGVTDPETLFQRVHDELVKKFPDITLRDVRDEITKYGKQVNVTKPELIGKINEIKRVGVLISKIEDAEAGLRPLRKLIGKEPPSPQERRLTRDLNELLKQLPPDEAEAYRKVKTASQAKETRLNNQITDLQDQLDKLKKGLPVEKTTKAAVPTTPEILKLEKQRDQLKAEITELHGNQELTDKEYLDKWRQRTERLLKKYEDRLERKDFSVKKKRELVHTAESAELLGQIEKVKKRYQAERLADHEKNASTLSKALKTAIAIPKAVILTSLSIFGKIGSFSAIKAATIPATEALQYGLSKLPFIGQIIRDSPTYGGGELSGKRIVQFYADLTNPMKFAREARQIFKTTMSSSQEKLGEHLPPIVNDSWSATERVLHIAGSLHAIAHQPLIGALEGYYKSKYIDFYNKKYTENVGTAAERNYDISDPVVLSALEKKALNAAIDESALGKNHVSSAWNNAVRYLENVKDESLTSKAVSKGTAAALKTLVPITTVPVNVANTFIGHLPSVALTKAIGDLFLGTREAARKNEHTVVAELMANGFKNLSEGNKEAFAKHVTQGAIGSALWLLGYYNRDKIGGLPFTKRDKEIKPVNEIEFFGHALPKLIEENPLLQIIVAGATHGHLNDQYLDGTVPNPKAEYYTALAKHSFEAYPFTNETVQIYRAIQSGERFATFMGTEVKNWTMGPFKGLLPVNAHPKTFGEAYTTRKPSTPEEKEAAAEEDIYQKAKKSEQEPTETEQKKMESKAQADEEKARIKDLKLQYQKFKHGDMTPEEKAEYLRSDEYQEYKNTISK